MNRDLQIELSIVEEYLREQEQHRAMLFAWMAEKFEEIFACLKITHFPQLNLNGTSYDELVRQQETVIAKINDALEAMANAAPHGRDFPQADEHTMRQAMGDHVEAMLMLTQIRDRQAKILQFVVESQIARERMKG